MQDYYKTLSETEPIKTVPTKTEGYPPIQMFSVGLLIGKRPFQRQCQNKTALFRVHCQQVPKTHYSSAEHRRPQCKNDERSSSSVYAV